MLDAWIQVHVFGYNLGEIFQILKGISEQGSN